MADKLAIKRAMIVTKYWRWEWHMPADGTMWARCKETGKIINFGRIT